ncbi:MAG TPA: hypothetical protein VGJ87_17825, partial [Roseiflexaceae bacterium]
TPADLLQRVLSDGQPHMWAALLKASGLAPLAAAEALSELIRMDGAIVLEIGDRRLEIEQVNLQSLIANLQSLWIISTSGWAALCDKLTSALRGYHRRYP